jgi:hypothetical protein
VSFTSYQHNLPPGCINADGGASDAQPVCCPVCSYDWVPDDALEEGATEEERTCPACRRENEECVQAELAWDTIPATDITCALTIAGDYVITHWPHGFTLSYRPPRKHEPMGTFGTLGEAKQVAERHQSTQRT